MKIIFNIIDSEIDHLARHKLFKGWSADGKLDVENNPNAYLDYSKFLAKPAIDCCIENQLKVRVENAKYAMRLAFIFDHDVDAMAFKLAWN